MKKVLGLALSLASTLLSSVASTAQPRQVPRAVPRSNMEALNVAYIRHLNEECRKVNATAPTATFDKALLVGTVLHTERMAVLDSLFHDADNHIAELVGTLVDGDPVETPVNLRGTYSLNSELQFRGTARYRKAGSEPLSA